MKKCELCDSVAKMYCESDQASLCWECDIKVHGANFLVAKHLRTLLCHVCQSPTPWNGSGPNLGPTVSVCESCAEHSSISVGRSSSLLPNSETLRNGSSQELGNAGDDEQQEEEDEEDEDGGNDTGEDHDEDDEENQVVPWSCSEECLSEGKKKFKATTSVINFS